MAQRYVKKVRLKEFSAGDLVLRWAVGSIKDLNAWKLALNWEGPCRVITIARVGAYYSEDLEERPLF